MYVMLPFKQCKVEFALRNVILREHKGHISYQRLIATMVHATYSSESAVNHLSGIQIRHSKGSSARNL